MSVMYDYSGYMFNCLDVNYLVGNRLVTAACGSGCVPPGSHDQSPPSPCTVMTLLCSFILLIIKLCLNSSMYNPYTSEHLNGDLRKSNSYLTSAL